MENQEEIEKQILEIVRAQHEKDGGNNGVNFGAFDHILNMSIEERNEVLQRMAKEKKIFIFHSLNMRRVILPK
ncbi:hypothetical protein C1631_002210 [Chryseobacterium phosphatilyticum]|uniref:Uncharacterized protein n=1 Tax=Chryseobacterium phosphatilyticum TaxID=475075 RepID=A0A316XC84_9FLAO|nr:hypothetical protein [Chryseobacterium phosphatilyticum]PWN71461.1 hypothetical protein C1631_002210 [Chryseobacterium phosphatilyticum]